MRRAEAEATGFTIDDHCNPPVAYKGPRFAPDELVVLRPATPLTTDHLRHLAAMIGNDHFDVVAIKRYADAIDVTAEASVPRLPCGHPRSKPPHIVGDGDFEAFREACEECGAVVPDAIDIERMGQ